MMFSLWMPYCRIKSPIWMFLSSISKYDILYRQAWSIFLKYGMFYINLIRLQVSLSKYLFILLRILSKIDGNCSLIFFIPSFVIVIIKLLSLVITVHVLLKLVMRPISPNISPYISLSISSSLVLVYVRINCYRFS